jgi:hypothetical protein
VYCSVLRYILPRVELVWRSHFNVLGNKTFQWLEGERFEETDDLVRSLEDGNVI